MTESFETDNNCKGIKWVKLKLKSYQKIWFSPYFQGKMLMKTRERLNNEKITLSNNNERWLFEINHALQNAL